MTSAMSSARSPRHKTYKSISRVAIGRSTTEHDGARRSTYTKHLLFAKQTKKARTNNRHTVSCLRTAARAPHQAARKAPYQSSKTAGEFNHLPQTNIITLIHHASTQCVRAKSGHSDRRTPQNTHPKQRIRAVRGAADFWTGLETGENLGGSI